MTGEAAGYWIAVALVVLGVFTIAVGELRAGQARSMAAASALLWIRPASVLVVLALFARALHAERRDDAVRPLIIFLTAAGAVTALAVLFQLVPLLNRVTVTGASSTSTVLAPTLSYATLTVAWSAVAVMALWRGFEVRSDVLAWAGLVMFGLTLTEILYTASEVTGEDWQVGAQVVRAATLAVGVAGATRGLQRLFALRSGDLFQSTVEAQFAEARIAAHRALAEEQAHEARNALMAIEGATTTLERYRHRLDTETRERLARAVTAEIERMQRLVHQRSPDVYRIGFTLAGVVDQQLVLARAQGMHVLADVRSDLQVLGRPADVAEVLQNLLTNARRHAPDSPVTLRAVDQGPVVHLRVEDRGPGVDPAQRDAIFSRGTRRPRGNGSGLGLYVSAKLMADQGGSLWVEDRPGGGASFVMALKKESP